MGDDKICMISLRGTGLGFPRVRFRRRGLLGQRFRKEHALVPGVARLVPFAHEIALLGLAYDGHERTSARIVAYLRADLHDRNFNSANGRAALYVLVAIETSLGVRVI